MDRFHPSALSGAEICWLLDVTFAGMTLRLSDREVDIVDEDGNSYHYHGDLQDLTVDEGVDFLSDASAAPISASVSAVLPCDVPLLISRGYDLSAGRAALYRWPVGAVLEKRRMVVQGPIGDPVSGSALDPVEFTIEANPWQDSAAIPSPSLTVSKRTWETTMLESVGESKIGSYYPLIFGYPGKVSTAVSSSGKITGSRAICVWATPTRTGAPPHGYYQLMWVIAGHHVSATRVYVNSNEHPSAKRVSVYNGLDKNGQAVALIPYWTSVTPEPDYPYVHDNVTYTYTYETTPDTDGNDTWCAGSDHTSVGGVIDQLRRYSATGGASDGDVFVMWVDDIGLGGGMSGPDGNVLRGAGDILHYLFSRAQIPVDHGRFGAAKALLNGYKLDFCIDEECSPWEFAQAHILPILPISMVAGPDGIYPVVWRHNATSRDSICHLNLTVDPTIERVSPVTSDRSSIVNDFTLQYAQSYRSGDFVGNIRISADSTDGATPDLFCRLSQKRYKRQDGSPLVSTKTITSEIIYDDGTAYAVLGWMAIAYCFARRRVSYSAPESVYGWLERGQVLTLTDSDLHFSEQVALLESISNDGSGRIKLNLLLVENPIRD